MAEAVSEYFPEQRALRMRVRTRNALGHWDWLIDGETGLPVEMSIKDEWVQSWNDPRIEMTRLGEYMLRIADRAAILEHKPW